MSEIIVKPNGSLSGTVRISGSKNSSLPIMAASLLTPGKNRILNIPNLSDINIMCELLCDAGATITHNAGYMEIDAKNLNFSPFRYNLVNKLRGSFLLTGPLLARLGHVKMPLPGGCPIGTRPIDLHLKGFAKLGAEISQGHGFVELSCKRLHGDRIYLDFPSVGATENIILAAATAKGVTVIHNAAKEPEISDLADFLNSAGARIYGSGSDTIYIYGVKKLRGTKHFIIPDRIVAATYMACAAITGGEVTLTGIMPSHMVSVLSVFRDAGCDIKITGKSLKISAEKRTLRVPTVRSLVYPGFPTDAGPVLIAMLSKSKGTSVFVENIFENRFRYIDELKRLGAKIKTEGKIAVIEGTDELSGANCKCTDLRGGAALVTAALAAGGETVISDIHHIERGYEDIVRDLKNLGANIRYSDY